MGLLVVLVVLLFFLAELLATLCNSSDGAGASVVWLAETTIIGGRIDSDVPAAGLQGTGLAKMVAATVEDSQNPSQQSCRDSQVAHQCHVNNVDNVVHASMYVQPCKNSVHTADLALQHCLT